MARSCICTEDGSLQTFSFQKKVDTGLGRFCPSSLASRCPDKVDSDGPQSRAGTKTSCNFNENRSQPWTYRSWNLSGMLGAASFFVPLQAPWTSIAVVVTGYSGTLTVISCSSLGCLPSSVQGSRVILAIVCCRRGGPVGLRKILSRRRGEMADKLRQYSSAGAYYQSSERTRDELWSIYSWSLVSLAC